MLAEINKVLALRTVSLARGFVGTLCVFGAYFAPARGVSDLVHLPRLPDGGGAAVAPIAIRRCSPRHMDIISYQIAHQCMFG